MCEWRRESTQRRNHRAWALAVALLSALWPEVSYLRPPGFSFYICKVKRLDWIIWNAAHSQGPCNWTCIQILLIEPSKLESITSHVCWVSVWFICSGFEYKCSDKPYWFTNSPLRWICQPPRDKKTQGWHVLEVTNGNHSSHPKNLGG